MRDFNRGSFGQNLPFQPGQIAPGHLPALQRQQMQPAIVEKRAHLVMPPSWGLFHRAILESPGLTQTKPLADAVLNYYEYLRAALLAGGSPGCGHFSHQIL